MKVSESPEVGELLGEGQSRKVYRLASDPGKVVKVAKRGKTHHNEREVKVWAVVCGTEREKEFCPVLEYCPDYKWLVMPYCQPVSKWPPFVPIELHDVKKKNIGMLEGRVVVIDYGERNFERVFLIKNVT